MAQVAPRLFAELVNLLDAFMEHFGRIHVRNPAVSIERRPPHRRFLAPGHPNRRMWFLGWLRIEGHAGKFGVTAFEADVFFGPKLLDYFESFIRARTPLPDRYAAGFEFLGKFATNADAHMV